MKPIVRYRGTVRDEIPQSVASALVGITNNNENK